jgi:hypothetical protein
MPPTSAMKSRNAMGGIRSHCSQPADPTDPGKARGIWALPRGLEIGLHVGRQRLLLAQAAPAAAKIRMGSLYMTIVHACDAAVTGLQAATPIGLGDAEP